jgi:hypothetical protein
MKRILLAIALLSFPAAGQARSYVLPHILETSGMSVAAVYTAGLGDSAVKADGAILELYLYASDGTPMAGQNGAPVCNPCSWRLTAQARKQIIDISALVQTSARERQGVGIFTVTSPVADAVQFQGFVTDPRTNEIVFGFDPKPIPGHRVGVRTGTVIPRH